MKKIQKQFLHSNYYKDGQFQALGTTYSLCLSCYTSISLVLFFLPVRSAETTDRTKKKTAFWFRTNYLHFIIDPIQASTRQETRNSSSVTHQPFIFFYTCPCYEKKKVLIRMARVFLYFYSSINQYNLVEWFR